MWSGVDQGHQRRSRVPQLRHWFHFQRGQWGQDHMGGDVTMHLQMPFTFHNTTMALIAYK